MSAPLKVKKDFWEMKEILDEYFQPQSEDDEEELEEQQRYLQQQEERELVRQANELKRKQEATAKAAARAKVCSKELDPDDAWQWDGEVKAARLLDKCPLTGEYVWKGRYEQHLPGGKWKGKGPRYCLGHNLSGTD
ncbi:hypothetical protein BDP27DRAFT_1432877 [Rhodocollybia butyracea]|uniref:Uncharacterized protein n=1 Tax=Rhodocollybia butyracea TaxID=206335 RepID=A0A9P5TYH1_9AGAR|nr:hypothetical protein BDP27DRAFT_1432877 [Rhodocollybia butyracea]